MKIRWLALSLVFVASAAWSQQITDILMQEPGSLGEGWHGFTDLGFLLNAFLTLALAAILGAIIAYHPKHLQTADTLEEIEAPKVFITYAVIGALIGIMVVKYGMVVGFVLFGIGGLIRFRTVLRSASLTGHVIFVTLIGLSCGLDLPHVAVLATVFGFILIFILNARITYRINIRALTAESIVASAAAYRSVLEQQRCIIMSEKKNPEKSRITFIFRSNGNATLQALEKQFDTDIDSSLQGALDWEID
ncbi:MAG: hypothetical protein HKN57_13585 [Xanthomonadales bacterium]|nr:hypothetical protein [Gammaproteobacteria bacterium]MBT8053931.1 hypothetical protein [Gammaproteobacteria bacterium]NND58272.1 hypothetical protein [Xanthomonadales bacterium]NNK52017.1 hypothetical protein [Xanthomonadales bacterium]